MARIILIFLISLLFQGTMAGEKLTEEKFLSLTGLKKTTYDLLSGSSKECPSGELVVLSHEKYLTLILGGRLIATGLQNEAYREIYRERDCAFSETTSWSEKKITFVTEKTCGSKRITIEKMIQPLEKGFSFFIHYKTEQLQTQAKCILKEVL